MKPSTERLAELSVNVLKEISVRPPFTISVHSKWQPKAHGLVKHISKTLQMN